MTVENASKVRGMHEKGRNQPECPMMTVDSEKKDCAMHKISRTELTCATVTAKNLLLMQSKQQRNSKTLFQLYNFIV